MQHIWKELTYHESHSIDDLFCSDSSEEDNRMMIDLKSSSAEESLEIASKGVQFKMEHSENNILLIDSPAKPSSMLIGNIPKEETIITSCIKAEDMINNSECMSKRSLNSEATKVKKPCATVEPEQCKEMEADSQSQTVIHRTIATPIISSTENRVNGETNARGIVENVGGHELHTVGSSENILSEKGSTDVTSAEIVHSSCEDKMCGNEEVDQLNTNTNDHSTLIPDERILVYNDEVAEEIEIDNTSDVPLDVLIHENLQSNKIDQKIILNVVGVPNDLLSIPSINVDTWKKTSVPKDVAPIEKQNVTSDKNGPKTNNTKDTTTTSPENQFLSSIVASSENCDNYVSLRQDSYTCNDLMLTHLFSEVNADEGSDDDHRFHNQRQYAGGGKIRAFRDQMEESKSDSEEFETHSPASRTDSVKSVVEALPDSNHQLNLIHPSIARVDEELKSVKSNQDKEATISEKCESPIKSNLDCPQLKRVSVDVSYMTKLDSINPVLLVNNEKISSKGMSASSDAILHTKTILGDINYELGVNNLFSLTPNSNVLSNTNHPVISPPSIRYRCQCMVCTDKYLFLVSKYHQLLFTISHQEDVKLTKLQETHAQQEQLLQSIQDSLNKKINNEVEINIIDKSIDTEHREELPYSYMESNHHSSTIDRNEPNLDIKSKDSSMFQAQISSLPPKKRKSFSLPSDMPLPKVRKSEHTGVSTVDRARNKCENNNNDYESMKVIKDVGLSETTKEDSMKNNEATKKFSPVKIKAIDGKYCVISETNCISSNTDADESKNINNESLSSKESKSKSTQCCYRKRKEEKKLRRERKRLKRQRRDNFIDEENVK